MGASPSAAILARAAEDTRLPALSFGVRVPVRGSARVHSIFAHPANLQLSGQRLIVLLAAQYPNVPNGIRIAATAWPRCQSCLRVGEMRANFNSRSRSRSSRRRSLPAREKCGQR